MHAITRSANRSSTPTGASLAPHTELDKATAVAGVTGYSAYWIGQLAKRYNAEGPAGMTNRQYTRSHWAAPLLSAGQLAELAIAVSGPAPDGDEWLGRTVAAWMCARLGRPVSVQMGWTYLVRLDGKRRTPRPRHVQADPAEQDAFKKGGRSASSLVWNVRGDS